MSSSRKTHVDSPVTQPKSIYVVEDEGIVALELLDHLRRLGYGIAGHAMRAEIALREIPARRPDLVLMDVNLGPGASGLDLVERLRAVSDVPVVYVTAYSDVELTERAARTGAFAFVVKPFLPEVLRANIEMALAQHDSARRLREANEELRLTASALEVLSTGLARLSGAAFFETCASELARIVGAEMGFVGVSLRGATVRIQTLGFSVDGRAAPPIEYPVFGTPCELVLRGDALTIPRDVQREFPADTTLVDLGAEAYVAAPLVDANGSTIGHVGVLARRPIEHPERVASITRLFALRVAAEVERQRAEARFRDIFEFSPDPIVMTNEQGRVTMANRETERVFGYTREELLRLSFDDLLSPTERDAHRAQRAQSLASSVPRAMGAGRPLEARRKDGSTLVVDIGLSPFESSDGRMVVAAVRDVTERARATVERERLEEQLRQAQKMDAIGTLAGGVAHDFNNVLTIILGNLEFVLGTARPDPPQAEALEEIRVACDKGRDLVRQILTFGRRDRTSRRPMRLRPVVEDAVRLLRATIPREIEIVTSPGGDAPPVMADATQVHQVLVNLCTNAWHAMEGRPGKIGIALSGEEMDAAAAAAAGGLAAGRYACLTVSDTGSGMDAATIARIFEPFFTTKPAGQGTGLGLAVAHGIIKSHGGAITVESRLGEGTCFRLFFPASAVDADERAERGGRSEVAGERRRVLLVDDEPMVATMAGRLLERLGFRVTTFTDPAGAIAAFAEAPGTFDLAIVDLNMPGRSGLDVTSAVREIRADFPVLVVSGRLDDDAKKKLLAAGARGVLHKPWTLAELADALRAL